MNSTDFDDLLTQPLLWPKRLDFVVQREISLQLFADCSDLGAVIRSST